MKIILLQDVKALGKTGQVVEVNDGYARNYILPKNLGVEANNRNLNDLKLKKASQDKQAAQRLQAAKDMAEQISAKSVVIKMKSGEGGKLFGAVSSKEIATAAKQQCGLELDKKKILLTDSIRAYGSYDVKIKLHPEVTGSLKVEVKEA